MGKCETSIYSRVTGYFQVLKGWNPGKEQEFKDRKKYKIDGLTGTHDLTGDDESRIRAKNDKEDMYPQP